MIKTTLSLASIRTIKFMEEEVIKKIEFLFLGNDTLDGGPGDDTLLNDRNVRLILYVNESRVLYPFYNESDFIANFEYFYDSDEDDILVGNASFSCFISRGG
jgi:hypothetical protein